MRRSSRDFGGLTLACVRCLQPSDEHTIRHEELGGSYLPWLESSLRHPGDRGTIPSTELRGQMRQTLRAFGGVSVVQRQSVVCARASEVLLAACRTCRSRDRPSQRIRLIRPFRSSLSLLSTKSSFHLLPKSAVPPLHHTSDYRSLCQATTAATAAPTTYPDHPCRSEPRHNTTSHLSRVTLRLLPFWLRHRTTPGGTRLQRP